MEYEIKMDGKEHKFGEATRYTKDGKGRFDLIPVESVLALINAIGRMSDEMSGLDENINVHIICNAFKGCYGAVIGYMMIIKYGDYSRTYDSTNIIRFLLPKMLAELAVHFQKGAKKYGPHNCEKGIPLWSFRDSGLRHMCQWLDGKNDENHFIAAIWNFMMAIWTIEVHPERCDDEIYTDTDDDKESDNPGENIDDSIEDDELDQEDDGHYIPEYNDFEIDLDEIKSDVRAVLEQMKQSKYGPISHDIKIFINKMANWVSDFDGSFNYRSTMNAILYDLRALLHGKDIDFTCYNATYSSLVPLLLDNDVKQKWDDDDRLYYTVYESIQEMRRIMKNVDTRPDEMKLFDHVWNNIKTGFNVYDEMPGTDLIKYIGYSEDVRSIIDMIDDKSDKAEFTNIIRKFNDDKMFSDICDAIAKEKHH